MTDGVAIYRNCLKNERVTPSWYIFCKNEKSGNDMGGMAIYRKFIKKNGSPRAEPRGCSLLVQTFIYREKAFDSAHADFSLLLIFSGLRRSDIDSWYNFCKNEKSGDDSLVGEYDTS